MQLHLSPGAHQIFGSAKPLIPLVDAAAKPYASGVYPIPLHHNKRYRQIAAVRQAQLGTRYP